jgi:hypothetical protein
LEPKSPRGRKAEGVERLSFWSVNLFFSCIHKLSFVAARAVVISVIVAEGWTPELLVSELYRHSNKFTPQGLLAGIVAGVAAAIPLGFLYVYGIWSIPEAKLRGLCPVGYGAAIGAACGLALVRGKVRNAKWAGIASGLA